MGRLRQRLVPSTLLAGRSKVMLAVLAQRERRDLSLLLAVATLGNSLGGMTSWLIGRLLPARRLEKRKYQRALAHVRHWGSPALLFSWAPVIGDPLCVAAGWLRIHWLLSLALVSAGNAARYALILLIV